MGRFGYDYMNSVERQKNKGDIIQRVIEIADKPDLDFFMEIQKE